MPKTLVLLVLGAVWTLVFLPGAHATVRYWSHRRRTFVPLASFHPVSTDDYDLAMLSDGRSLVVLAALLNLEEGGALELTRSPFRLTPRRGATRNSAPIVARLTSTPVPIDHPVEQAVYRAVVSGCDTEERIADHSHVVAVVDDLEARMVETGLFHPQRELLQLRRDKRWFELPPPEQSPVGTDLLRRLRKTCRGTKTPRSLATRVGLHGRASLWQADPALARFLGVPRSGGNGVFAPPGFASGGCAVGSGGSCGGGGGGGGC